MKLIEDVELCQVDRNGTHVLLRGVIALFPNKQAEPLSNTQKLNNDRG